jgi:hypothetical protein
MTTGAVIFAFNNEQIDYVAMAAWSARNIRRHLNIPVCLVTDSVEPVDQHFDQVRYVKVTGTNGRYFSDYNANVTWHNESRADAYSLSPWDCTLVLDADYVVASDQLLTVLEADQDFLAHKQAYDVTGLNTFDDLNWFGAHRMPMSWATVMMFRRSQHAELIFDVMQMVRDNWSHYRNLYKNTKASYRNDHALSIALNLVNGNTQHYPYIPWRLASLTPEHLVTQTNTDAYRIEFVTPDQRPKWIALTGQDFHAMGKQQLGAIVANSC